MRQLKIEQLVSQADRDWLAERITSGHSPTFLAACLRRMGYDGIVARDVKSWSAHMFGQQAKGSAPTAEDRYCRTIERMHEFCEARQLPFKVSMIEAIEGFMKERE